MRVYHLKSCDTCRKAIKGLTTAGAAMELRDVRADGIDPGDLERIVEGAGWEAALNRRSTTWRGLGDADKADMDAHKAQALIAAHPTLLKRPAILDGDLVTVGWSATAQAEWV